MCFAKNQWILLLSVLFLARNMQVESILTRGPSDVVAVKGSTVVFSCYTNLSRPVYWDTEKAGDNYENTWYAVYQGNPSFITMQFETRFSISIDPSHNHYNLTIRDVQMEDAGTYRCGDNFGLALQDYKRGIPNQGAVAELTVIGSNLTCSQNISVHNIDGSEAVLTDIINCSLPYEGRIIPTLKLITGNDSDQSKHEYILSQINAITNDRHSTLTSTIIISAPQRIGKSSVTCSVLTSGGNLTGFERQSYNNSIPDLRCSNWGIAGTLIGGILLGIGLLSVAIIALYFGRAVTLHEPRTLKIWMIRITFKIEPNEAPVEQLSNLTPANDSIYEAPDGSTYRSIEWSNRFAPSSCGEFKTTFDDSDLISSSNPDQDLYITGMKFYYRYWAKLGKIIGGFKVTYSNGTTRLHGSDQGKYYFDEEPEGFTLDEDEKIVKVAVWSGNMIDGMCFETNKRRLGHFGGYGGTEQVTQGPQPSLSYLTIIKGKVYFTDEALAVNNLQFCWATRMRAFSH